MDTNLNKIARDPKTKAIVVLDDQTLAQYKKRKAILRQKNKKIDQLENRLDSLETKLDMILTALTKE
jgi:hypothetical protein